MCGVDVGGEWVEEFKIFYRRGFRNSVLKWDEPETPVFVWG